MAILLSAAGEEQVLRPLSPNEIAIAAKVRDAVWPLALQDLKDYVVNKQVNEASTGLWFEGLRPKEVEAARPFPTLPPLKAFLPLNATVDPEPFKGEYGFEKTTLRWRLSDRLLLGLYNGVYGDEQRLRELIRLFLFHEYLHDYHSVTKNTADEVGKFANCLEYLDYTADTYAILHQLDLARSHDTGLLESANARKFLASQVELAIRSFWAFDADLGSEWQVRRVRRYLNWYWRLTQLENGSDLVNVMPIFCRPPHVEIGGLYQVGRARRVVAFLNRQETSTLLELAIVLENDKLFRLPASSASANLPALLQAFVKADHDEIKRFFASLEARYGQFIDSAQTPDAKSTMLPDDKRAVTISYLFRFERDSVEGLVELRFFSGGLTPTIGFIHIRDGAQGDLVFPASAAQRASDAATRLATTQPASIPTTFPEP